MELSKRMLSVVSFVPTGSSVCDVGCDHGFVSIYLIEQGICNKVLATDVGKGPLQRATTHVEEAGLSAYIETRLSDGLIKVEKGETDGMIAAGMGGRLMAKILSDSMEKVRGMKFLVLQPQSEMLFFRSFLREHHLEILAEDMVLEDGKYYPVLFVKPQQELAQEDKKQSATGNMTTDATVATAHTDVTVTTADADAYRQSLADEFGPCLIRDKHEILKSYLDFWEKHQNNILEQVRSHPERFQQVQEELKRIRDTREWMAEPCVKQDV